MEEEIKEQDFDKLLDDFIKKELQNSQEQNIANESSAANAEETPAATEAEEPTADEPEWNLEREEKAFFEAYKNFASSCSKIANNKGKHIKFKISPQILYPRYKPLVAEELLTEISSGWDLLLASYPEEMKKIKPDSSDEELLNFTETLSDCSLQLAIISYVETLIELDGCEIAYESRRIKAKRHKLERQLYEEHQKRKERIARCIAAIKHKELPINGEKLVNNFFGASKKDLNGAYEIVTNNPAMFSPIEFDKIKPKFFGLIKPTPQDGIRWNKRIGNFMKKLKI